MKAGAAAATASTGAGRASASLRPRSRWRWPNRQARRSGRMGFTTTSPQTRSAPPAPRRPFPRHNRASDRGSLPRATARGRSASSEDRSMHDSSRAACWAAALAVFGAAPLAAQTDFRNLDEARPIRTEDALPVDHYGFELSLPYALEAEARDPAPSDDPGARVRRAHRRRAGPRAASGCARRHRRHHLGTGRGPALRAAEPGTRRTPGALSRASGRSGSPGRRFRRGGSRAGAQGDRHPELGRAPGARQCVGDADLRRARPGRGAGVVRQPRRRPDLLPLESARAGRAGRAPGARRRRNRGGGGGGCPLSV